MNVNEYKKRMLAKPGVQKVEEKNRIAYAIAEMIIEARVAKGLTQKELATLVGTKQPSIARIENGEATPGNSFLERIAEALGTKLLPPRFEMLVEDVKFTYSNQPIIKTEYVPISIVCHHVSVEEYNMRKNSDTTVKLNNISE